MVKTERLAVVGSALVAIGTLLVAGTMLGGKLVTAQDWVRFIIVLMGGVGALLLLIAVMSASAKRIMQKSKRATEKKVKTVLREYAHYLAQMVTKDDSLYTSYEDCLLELEKRTGLSLHGD